MIINDVSVSTLRPKGDGSPCWDSYRCEVGSRSVAIYKSTCPASKQPTFSIDLTKVIRAQAVEHVEESAVGAPSKKGHFLELCIKTSGDSSISKALGSSLQPFATKYDDSWDNRGIDNLDARGVEILRFRAEASEDVHQWAHSIQRAKTSVVSSLESNKPPITHPLERNQSLHSNTEIVGALIEQLNLCIAMANEEEDTDDMEEKDEEDEIGLGMEMDDLCNSREDFPMQSIGESRAIACSSSPMAGTASAALHSPCQLPSQSPLSAIRRALDVLESITRSPLATSCAGPPSQSPLLVVCADKSAAAIAALEEAVRAVDGDQLERLPRGPLQPASPSPQTAAAEDMLLLTVDDLEECEECEECEEGETLEEMMDRWAAREGPETAMQSEAKAEAAAVQDGWPAPLGEVQVNRPSGLAVWGPVQAPGGGRLRLVYAVAAVLAVLAAAVALSVPPAASRRQTELEVYELDQVIDPLPLPASRLDARAMSSHLEALLERAAPMPGRAWPDEAVPPTETVDDLVADIQRSLASCPKEGPGGMARVGWTDALRTWRRRWRRRLEGILRRIGGLLAATEAGK